MDAPPRPTLSPLALRLLRLVGPEGMTELQAAQALNYSRQHVANTLSEAYRQLGAKNARQAIYLATRCGLLR
jgi:DNA-binding CsgD family transcriptional regulator